MILYNIHTCGSGFMVGKFDEDINVLGTYIVEPMDGYICDCPGWPRKRWCKHCDMIKTFRDAGKIDSDEFYDPETKSWHRPLAYPQDEMNEALAYSEGLRDEHDKEDEAAEAQPGRYDDGAAFHPAFGPIKRRF